MLRSAVNSGTFAGGLRFNAIFYNVIITRTMRFVKYKITKNYKNIYIILLVSFKKVNPPVT